MRMSEAEFERQYAEATRRGEIELQTQPLAIAVRFDRRTRCVVINLNKGSTLSVPVDLLEALQGATLKDLSRVEILGPGFDIEWPTLDQQFHVKSLLNGMFGSKKWMAMLRERSSPETLKSKSARTNGKRTARPRQRTAVSAYTSHG